MSTATKNETTEETTTLERARALIRRGAPYRTDDLRMIVEGGRSLPDDEPLSAVDRKLARSADRAGYLFPEAKPDPETPFDAKLEEAEAEEARRKAALEEGKEKLYKLCRDVDLLTGTGHVLLQHGKRVVYTGDEMHRRVPRPDPDHVREAMDEAEDAANKLDRLEEDFKEARVEANELRRNRSRWLQRQRVEAQ